MINVANSWAFPAIEAAHLCGVALFAGSTIVFDVRNLGWKAARESATEVAKRLKPWSHAGLAILLLTGATMLFSDWDRYRHNAAVGVKMVLLIPALGASMMPRRGKLASIVSLLSLTAVVIAARAIADFDVL